MSAHSSSRKGSNEKQGNSKSPRKREARQSDVPRNRNAGRWTEGRFRAFIASTLRGGFRRWPPKYDVLKSAFAGRKINKKSGREANHYVCAECGDSFPQSNVQVDHVYPIGDWSDLNVVVEKLFCEASNLQVLCKPCHKKKTKQERDQKIEDRKESGNT